MTDPASPGGPMLSVRGEARQVVVPDYVILAGAIALSRESKAEAVRAAASGLDRLTAGLTALGAVELDVESERHPLTWSAQAATTHVERDHNKKTGRYEPTGRVSATVAMVITVRAFDRLAALGAALAAHEALSVNEVSWHVDWDNPGWPQSPRVPTAPSGAQRAVDAAVAGTGDVLNGSWVPRRRGRGLLASKIQGGDPRAGLTRASRIAYKGMAAP
jgi:hypothetical protein